MEKTCQVPRWKLMKGELNNLPPVAFAAAIQECEDMVLLDCRTPSEFESGHLPGAINFNYLTQDFVGQMEQLDPSKTYFIYCRSERRSLRTCVLLKNGGFKKIYHLDGGLNEWLKVFDLEGVGQNA